jgi:hypothetical protein
MESRLIKGLIRSRADDNIYAIDYLLTQSDSFKSNGNGNTEMITNGKTAKSYGNGVAEDASDAISVDEGDWIGLSDGD